MSVAYDQDDERDHQQAMIDWLADKSPEVWHAVALDLNWDNALGVFDWIISQRECDRGTAAFVFWSAGPLYAMRALATNEWRCEESLRLITKIIRNWKTGFYLRDEIAWKEDHRADYAVARQNLGGSDPLAIPEGLLSPQRGRPARVPEALRAENNDELRALLYALGTDVGPSQVQLQRAQVIAGVKENMAFYAKAAPWLLAFFILAMGAAILLRYIHKGVWL